MEASERWRPVPAWPDYEASDHGRVRRATPYGNTWKGKVLKPWVSPRHGYATVSLSSSGVRRTKRVHHLVLAAFVGPRPKGMETNHIDGDKTNNRLSNLEYVTPSENTQHAVDNGLFHPRRGERHPDAILTAEDVRDIRAAYSGGGVTQYELAEEHGVSQPAICALLGGKTWKHV